MRALERGEGPTSIARRLEVDRSFVWRVGRRLADTGRRKSLPMGGHRRPRLASLEGTIRSWIKEQPDLTIDEMRARLAERGVRMSVGGMWTQLDRWGLSYKKKRFAPASRTART